MREVDDSSIKRFDTVEALNQLEAIDVENGEYEAWDGTGRKLRLNAIGVTRMRSGTIKVEITEELITDELRADS